MGHAAWLFFRGCEEPVRQPWRQCLSREVRRARSEPGFGLVLAVRFAASGEASRRARGLLPACPHGQRPRNAHDLPRWLTGLILQERAPGASLRTRRLTVGIQVPVMCSGRTGTWCSDNPVASRMAAMMAGPEEMVGASPTPRTP